MIAGCHSVLRSPTGLKRVGIFCSLSSGSLCRDEVKLLRVWMWSDLSFFFYGCLALELTRVHAEPKSVSSTFGVACAHSSV